MGRISRGSLKTSGEGPGDRPRRRASKAARPPRPDPAPSAAGYPTACLDPDAPETRELGRLIVPGRFKHACLGRLVAEWAGRHGFVRRLLCRYGEADTVGRPLTCAGEVRRLVVDGEQRLVYLKIWVANAEGRITTLGTATVVWTGP